MAFGHNQMSTVAGGRKKCENSASKLLGYRWGSETVSYSRQFYTMTHAPDYIFIINHTCRRSSNSFKPLALRDFLDLSKV
ncbi:unnamed protein product [Allacma fusca]|uniref:Uncharacterized protein n=1 Tax=Allacma fusca TaxID=39272 RepID=A0A8J2KJC5_9HEXA|nr:unnamed protein product [Allacma fusca]